MDRCIIRNARVLDGIDGYMDRDILIQDQIIQALLPQHATVGDALELEAQGLLAVPGFIDIHRHGDLKPFADQPWDELTQGITTMVNGNCGFSPVPNTPETFIAVSDYAAPIMGRMPPALCGITAEAFFRSVQAQPLGLNIGYLVGNGSLRRAVAGFSDSRLTKDQFGKILTLLKEALDAGALGLSMGIMYSPECYYNTEELARIAAVAARYGRPVIAHIRSEGRNVLNSVAEMIQIGEKSGAHIHISHLKAAGTEMWGHAVDQILEMIDAARSRGIQVTFDAYPYAAGSTTLLSLLPPEVLTNGTAGVLRELESPERRQYILDQFRQNRQDWDNFVKSLGWERVIISGSSRPEEAGKSVMELADLAQEDPGSFALELLRRDNGQISIILEEMDPDDVKKILSRDDCIVISDALYSQGGKPHPRRYGAFPRFLCKYVKEEKLVSLQQAIRKMTALPAELLALHDRGRIREGCRADIVLLDWEKLKDRATYTQPNRGSEGIVSLLVNGEIACHQGSVTGNHAGRLLTCKPVLA